MVRRSSKTAIHETVRVLAVENRLGKGRPASFVLWSSVPPDILEISRNR
jgi:hypothetical protein